MKTEEGGEALVKRGEGGDGMENWKTSAPLPLQLVVVRTVVGVAGMGKMRGTKYFKIKRSQEDFLRIEEGGEDGMERREE